MNTDQVSWLIHEIMHNGVYGKIIIVAQAVGQYCMMGRSWVQFPGGPEYAR